MRTDQDIVGQTQALARRFYETLGYVVPEGYDFQAASHPQERAMWSMACIAQEELTETDATESYFRIMEGDF